MSSIDDGLVVRDLQSDAVFARRNLHPRDRAVQLEAVRRLSQARAGKPSVIPQELVNAAIDICGADSAGISLVNQDGEDAAFYRWIATAGEYARYLNAMLPRVPSACGICIERGRPQLFTVSQQFFKHLGVEAAEVTDGILLPWQAGEALGTIWILAHGRSQAFDQEDYRIMEVLASLAAAGVRQQQRHVAELVKAKAAGAALKATEVARRLKLPLQTAKAVADLVERSRTSVEAKLLAEELSSHIEEVSAIVKGLTVAHSRKNPIH